MVRRKSRVAHLVWSEIKSRPRPARNPLGSAGPVRAGVLGQKAGKRSESRSESSTVSHNNAFQSCSLCREKKKDFISPQWLSEPSTQHTVCQRITINTFGFVGLNLKLGKIFDTNSSKWMFNNKRIRYTACKCRGLISLSGSKEYTVYCSTNYSFLNLNVFLVSSKEL